MGAGRANVLCIVDTRERATSPRAREEECIPKLAMVFALVVVLVPLLGGRGSRRRPTDPV